MKKLLILIIAFVANATIIFAQAPETFSYQSVVRNSSGSPIINTQVSFRISILKGTVGNSVFKEIHNVSTNPFGLVNLTIGKGQNISGSISTINWGNDTYFIQLELDATGGTNYTLMGTSQLLSVPYALYAKSTSNTDDADADPTNELQVLSISNDTIYLTSGGFVKLPAVQTGSVPTNTCLMSPSITPPLGYNYSGNYNESQPSWNTKAPLSAAKYTGTISELNGKIYFIGGYNGTSSIATTEVYDPGTDSWTIKSAMPTARTVWTAVVNGKIYAIGGNKGTISTPNITDINEEYNPVTDSWTTKASMPTARNSFGIGVVNDKIYVFGGINSSSQVTSKNEVYDPSTNSWTTKSDGPSKTYANSAVVVDNDIYHFGGSTGTNYLSTVRVYSTISDTWSTKASMPVTLRYPSANRIGDKIYVFGGSINSSTSNSTVYEYTISTNTWKSIANMLTTRGTSSSVVDNKIYVIGGSTFGSTYFSENEVFIPSQFYYIHCKN